MPLKRVKSSPPTTIETQLRIGPRSAPATVKINKRARRMIVRVDQVTGRVLVTTPSRRSVPEAIAFARSRADWIAAQIEDGSGPMPFVPGEVVPYLGVDHMIEMSGGARSIVRIGPRRTIQVGGDEAHCNRRVTDFLKKEARREITERVDYYANLVGRKRGVIRIRDMKSRWGSCSSEGAMSFSWRLILTPSEILDYVAAHECAHLAHLNHSRAFWRLVEKLDVDAEAARIWFEENGQSLFAWGVDA